MKTKALIILSALLVLLIPLLAQAAVCPDVTFMSMIGGGSDYAPNRIAIDQKGNMYVADSFNDRVYVYDYKGVLKKVHSMPSPLGITVDNNGKIYIGTSKNNRGFHRGEVGIYDGSLTYLYSLGIGWGEFQRPEDIIVDGGQVIVADSSANQIKIYDEASHALLYTFGSYGNQDGDLVKPTGIDILHADGSLTISNTELAVGAVGLSYSQLLVAGGGAEPYTWALTAGSLPDGLTLNSTTGEIAGTPALEGVFNFTVQATDAASMTTERALSIEIYPADALSDDFEDGVIGQQWGIYTSNTGDHSTETGGALNISIPAEAGSARFSGIKLAQLVSGDFDFQVDFSNLARVGANLGGVFFHFEIDGSNKFHILRYDTGANTSLILGRSFVGGVNENNTITSATTSGKLRLQRTGSVVNLYVDTGAGWQLVHTRSGFSTAAGELRLIGRADDSTSVSFDYDNFRDNLYISPPPPPPTPLPATGDKLYIADRALHYSDYQGNAGWSLGAGAHIFSKEGQFIQRFGAYGYEEVQGNMVSPVGLVLDHSNRVIISDNSKGQLKIFDFNGNSVCDINLGAATPYPLGMEISDDGRLFVASNIGIYVIGLDDYVTMGVSPTSLGFDAGQCGGGAPSQNITISNNGPGVLNWNIASDAAWLVPSVASGSINGQASVNVAIDVDSTGLSAGTHNGTITVTSQGAEETIDVTLNVPDSIGFTVSPASLSFEVSGSTMPPAKTLTVAADGQGEVLWDAAVDSPWISVTPSSGSTNTTYVDNVSISEAGLAGLSSGSHTGTITVSSACSTTGPVDVPVYLNYIKGGDIRVTTNYDGADFTISGPATYSGTGTLYEVQGTPEGNYTITFADAQGLIKPASYSLDVSNGGLTEFSGTYTDLRERNNIIASIGGAPFSMAEEIRIFDGNGVLQGSITVGPADPAQADIIRQGCETSTGDLDGDGNLDILVGRYRGTVTGYNVDGTEIPGLSFKAFPYDSDVVVTAGDFDGDGKSEIVVGAGNKSGNYADIRIFSYEGGTVNDTGVYFRAYDKKKGVNVIAGDLDGDGVDELITTDGGNGKRTVVTRVWTVDTSAGMGAWTVYEQSWFDDGLTNTFAELAIGDINANGQDEIIVSVYDSDTLMAHILIFGGDGTLMNEFTVSHPDGNVSVAVGDLDFDGIAEVIVGEGENATSTSNIKVYSADGTYRGEFPAFDNPAIFGVKVSVGQLMGE